MLALSKAEARDTLAKPEVERYAESSVVLWDREKESGVREQSGIAYSGLFS